MTEHFEPARTAGSATPVLVVVDADRQARIATEAALVRRFEPDYCQAVTRAVIIATGVTYRRLDIPGLDRFVSTGVFYDAAGVEAPAMAAQEVYVIGGANSAGQAALHLARFALPTGHDRRCPTQPQGGGSGREVRTAVTTSLIAWLAAAASVSSRTSEACVASATIRWRLLVERVASLSCANIHSASCPRPAVITISGLLAKSAREGLPRRPLNAPR